MENSSKFLESSKQFLSSNSFIAKLSFIILIIIAFILLFNFSYWVMNMVLSPSRSPYLINGMKDAKTFKIITQDINQAGSIPIYRSNNQHNGIEMTWSSWIYIDDPTYLQTKGSNHNVVYVKGSNANSIQTMNVVSDAERGGTFKNSNAPGVYLQPEYSVTSSTFESPPTRSNLIKMNLVILVDIFPFREPNSDRTIYNQKITIEGIPIKKWVSIIIRFSTQNIVDVFINGSLNQRVKLYNTVRQNYDDVFINSDGGFDGFLSNLKYYDYSIGTFEINQIVSSGPNLSMPDDTNIKNSNPYYLSTKWMFGEKNVS